MKKCVTCGQRGTFHKGLVPHSIHVGDYEFAGKVVASICPNCRESYVSYDSLGEFEQNVADKIIRSGMRTGSSFRFLRKTIGLSAVELARIIGVRPESISRWESGRRVVDRGAFFELESLVAESASGERPSVRSMIDALNSPKELARRVSV